MTKMRSGRMIVIEVKFEHREMNWFTDTLSDGIYRVNNYEFFASPKFPFGRVSSDPFW